MSFIYNFSALRKDYDSGLSPGVLLLYNQHIMFGKVLEHVTRTLGGDALATGHYVRRTGFDFTTPHQQILGMSMGLQMNSKNCPFTQSWLQALYTSFF